MGDSFVRVPADSVGKRVDATSLDVGANTVYRQRIVIGDDGGTANFAAVVNNSLQIGGTIDKISATVAVTGTVALAAGTANIGTINNISATVNVAGTFTISTIDKISATVAVVGTVSLAAGSILDSISATVGVKGQVSLAAGTSNIGFINNISATVIVAGVVTIGATVGITGTVALAAGTIINNISATVAITGTVQLVAGTANIGTINNISATVNVAGTFTINTIDKISATVTVVGAVSLLAGSILDSISATVGVKGQVSLGPGTSNIGFINNISATVAISGTVALAAGTVINNISATVAITGTVQLVAGTANFGTLNDISRTVQVAIGTPFILQGISTTVIVAMSNQVLQGISTTVLIAMSNQILQGISTTVQTVVAGRVAISASITVGDQPVLIGGVRKDSASGTATAIFGWFDGHGKQVHILNHPSVLPSASHGPRCVTISTSAAVALIAAPGAGLCIYITGLDGTNGSSTLTRNDVYPDSATASCVSQMYMAASGGGFIKQYNPPVKVLSNTQVTVRVKPAVSKVIMNVHFFVGAK